MQQRLQIQDGFTFQTVLHAAMLFFLLAIRWETVRPIPKGKYVDRILGCHKAVGADRSGTGYHDFSNIGMLESFGKRMKCSGGFHCNGIGNNADIGVFIQESVHNFLKISSGSAEKGMGWCWEGVKGIWGCTLDYLNVLKMEFTDILPG